MTTDTTAVVPAIYDVITGTRPITQADVDRLQAIERAYRAMRYIMHRVLGDHHMITQTDSHREAAFLRQVVQKIVNLTVNK